ncbi:alpha/beta hydrolase [Planomonospora parontospora]|uniref:alpha/beta hydrolase n=1 Tax=Planomonospora parontospora TaxID=58119 RepID=UPI00167188C2|nr:alpha/beta hydrolase [Planomonospora parontospora]GGL29411.1 acetylhydrolase [Planomonospora parontospora subsp. antibiotica]GII19729.1 acetylhydrolase [Planomonospora parontospora subsp. antibiotica]
MALHPQAEAYLKLFPTDLGTPLAELTPEMIAEMRALDGFAEQRGPVVPLPVVRDGSAGGVPVRVYRADDGDHPLPVIVYFHGGGWVFGSVARNDALARDLAVRTGAVVVSVDYRLAPEHPFPAAADDALAAVRDVFARPAAYGADPGRIAVLGDSAGGNLAAVAAWQARDAGLRLAHQVLVYPVADVAMDTPSYRTYAAGYGLGADEMAWFAAQYGGDPADPRLAPLRLADKAGLAPATVLTAECDPLCDEGEAYAAGLAAAGVPVEYRCYAGAIHGFFGLPGFFDQAAEAREYATARLKEAFA